MNPYFSASAFFAGISRRAFLWRGILVGLLGLLVALNPLITLELLSILLGWVFAAVGIWAILSGAVYAGQRFFWIIYGLLMLLGGVFMIFQPFQVVFVIAWFIAIWFIAGGAAGIWNTAQMPVEGKYKVLPTISGFVGLFIGFLFLIWPLTSLAGMLWIAGLILIVRGAMLIAFSRILPEQPRMEENETGKMNSGSRD